MARQTIYLAQPFTRKYDGFHPLSPLIFPCASAAEEAGRALAPRYDGLLVMIQTGDPDWNVWDEPEILAEYGFVPLGYSLAA